MTTRILSLTLVETDNPVSHPYRAEVGCACGWHATTARYREARDAGITGLIRWMIHQCQIPKGGVTSSAGNIPEVERNAS